MMFQSSFWPWAIGAVVVLSIVFLFWLILWMSGGKKTAPGEEVETMGHVWDGDLEEYSNPLPGWWLNLFYITLFFGIAYLILYPGMGFFSGAIGWTQTGQYEAEMQRAEEEYGPLYQAYLGQPVEVLSKNDAAMQTGERLFQTYCSVCHGSEASGGPGFPNLRDNDWLYGGTPEKIKESIAKGRTAMGMMAWKDILGGDAGVKDVAQYVLSLSGRAGVDAEAAERGKAKFMICSGCHGMDGTGNQMLGAPNLTDDIWLYGGSQRAIEESITKGRQGIMPPHQDFLGDAKVHLLTAYVYSLSHKGGVTPAAVTAPVVEETPAVETAPVDATAPATEEVPAEPVPATEETPAAEVVAEPATATEEAPAEPVPASEEAPAAEAVPAEATPANP